jgi:beta-N-acetylhexosaminidase
VISDDLEMKAVAEHFALDETVPASLGAGVDALLVCHHADVQNRAIDLARQAFESGALPRARLDEAQRRIAGLMKYVAPEPDPRALKQVLRSPAHLALAERLPRAQTGHDPTAV